MTLLEFFRQQVGGRFDPGIPEGIGKLQVNIR
jgi:hypothetical protein